MGSACCRRLSTSAGHSSPSSRASAAPDCRRMAKTSVEILKKLPESVAIRPRPCGFGELLEQEQTEREWSLPVPDDAVRLLA